MPYVAARSEPLLIKYIGEARTKGRRYAVEYHVGGAFVMHTTLRPSHSQSGCDALKLDHYRGTFHRSQTSPSSVLVQRALTRIGDSFLTYTFVA